MGTYRPHFIATLKDIKGTVVRFKKPIYEDDFVEPGMKAWFIGYDFDKSNSCWTLYFNFEDFEGENKKFFRRVYRESNLILDKIKDGKISKNSRGYTALEADAYTPEYSVYYSAPDDSKDANIMLGSLTDYLDIL